MNNMGKLVAMIEKLVIEENVDLSKINVENIVKIVKEKMNNNFKTAV